MKILGLIPARGGSKGIPGKNIKLLNGKPLLYYTYEAAKNSLLLSKFILSTDSAEIMQIGEDLGFEVPFLRPLELAQDDTGSLEVIQHALNLMELDGEVFEAVCLLEPTSPFRRENLIDEAIHTFIENGFDSLISVRQVPLKYNPHWIFEERNGSLIIATGEENIIKQRQALPKAYHRDGALYISRTAVIKNKNSIYGKNIGYIDTTESPYIDLDEVSDWEKAEQILKNH